MGNHDTQHTDATHGETKHPMDEGVTTEGFLKYEIDANINELFSELSDDEIRELEGDIYNIVVEQTKHTLVNMFYKKSRSNMSQASRLLGINRATFRKYKTIIDKPTQTK